MNDSFLRFLAGATIVIFLLLIWFIAGQLVPQISNGLLNLLP